MILNTVLKVYVPAQMFLARQTRLFVKRTEGASGIEYAIIAAMVAVVIVASSGSIRDSVSKVFTTIATDLGTTVDKK